jgi:hypothetical protein
VQASQVIDFAKGEVRINNKLKEQKYVITGKY